MVKEMALLPQSRSTCVVRRRQMISSLQYMSKGLEYNIFRKKNLAQKKNRRSLTIFGEVSLFLYVAAPFNEEFKPPARVGSLG
jgi:hypothetical protein